MKRLLLALLLLPHLVFATTTTETTKTKYTCDGSTTTYAYPFKIFEDDDLLVVQTDTNDVTSTLTLNVDYTVTGAGSASGTVVLTDGASCTATDSLTLLRNVEKTQETDYVDGEIFSAESMENALDKLTMLLQQQNEGLGRSIKFPVGDTTDGTLAGAGTRANNLLYFDEDGAISYTSALQTYAGQLVENYGTLQAIDITSLSDKDPAIVQFRSTKGDGGGGIFYWDSSDLSMEVTADTQSGIYVAPTTDATGASGAWVRQYSGPINPQWFTSFAGAVAWAPSGASIFCPQGYSDTVSSSIDISKNLTIYSDNRDGVTITGPTGAAIFQGSGTVTQFVLRGITWVGGSGASQLLRIEGTESGNSWFEARIVVENNRINGFGDFALYFGDSVYTRYIKGNRFDNCTGSIYEGFASDSFILDNFFNDNEGTNPVMTLVGGSRTVLVGNEFITGTGSITAPDILIDPKTSYGQGGRIYASHNKFGAEGDVAGRPKVRVFNATTTNRSPDVTFFYNQFHGAGVSAGGTTTAFLLDNPIVNWDISHNEFDDVNIIIDDNYTSAGGEFGTSFVGQNRYFTNTRQAYKLFDNGGRGFNYVDSPQTGEQWGHKDPPENIELRNRISYSSALTNWNKSTGVTITGSQADPYGGTDAALFTRDGLSASQIFYRAIDKSTGGAWSTDSLIVKFWAKAGTASQMLVGLRNTTDGNWAGALLYVSLGSDWRQYEINCRGLDNSKAYALYHYIVDTSAVSGSVYYFAPQVSEYVSDYVPTPINVGVADTSTSHRFVNPVQFVSGIKPGGGTVTWTSGSGDPEGSVTANVGAIFTRTDGGAGTTLYVKESGTGNTGWAAK